MRSIIQNSTKWIFAIVLFCALPALAKADLDKSFFTHVPAPVSDIDHTGMGTFNGTYTHNSTDHPWFVFNANAGDIIQFSINTPWPNGGSYSWLNRAPDGCVEIGDFAGNGTLTQVATGGPGGIYNFSYTVLTTGQFALQLDSWLGGSGNYTVTISGSTAATVLCSSADQDGDGILDANDNCPTVANAGQENNDGDSEGDVCDSDDDNDGVTDLSDNCPFTANPDQANNDADANGDACDADDDNDGVLDANDNCPLVANANQLDTDGDGQGDACDPDDDNDGVLDANDNCPLVANADQLDTDGDGQGNACDGDDDGDGVPDAYDCAPLDSKNTKWLVCHNGNTICIAQPAVQAHLAHGDYLGACAAPPAAGRSIGHQQLEVAVSNAKFGVYPNPSKGRFSVQINNSKAAKAEVWVVNTNGTIVEKRQVQLTGKGQTLDFNLRGKANGMYMVKVITADGIQTLKLNVQQ